MKYKGKLKPAKSRLANKRIRRGVRAGLIAYCAKLNAVIERETQEAFEEYYEKIRESDTENENLYKKLNWLQLNYSGGAVRNH